MPGTRWSLSSGWAWRSSTKSSVGNATRCVIRLGAFLGTLFDFQAIELDAITERTATLRIDYGMQPVAEEAACWQTQGFF